METPPAARRGLKVSTPGLIIGILIGAFYLFLAFGAHYAVGRLIGYAQSSGVTISSNVLSFVAGEIFLVLAVAIVMVKIAHRAIEGPLTARGPLKIVLGALQGVYYYMFLAGGAILLTVGLKASGNLAVSVTTSGSLAISITLLVTLALLELSSALKMLQGVFELREGMRGSSSSGPPMTTPTVP